MQVLEVCEMPAALNSRARTSPIDRSGWSVAFATGAGHASAECVHAPPDVVVIDLSGLGSLPRYRGLESEELGEHAIEDAWARVEAQCTGGRSVGHLRGRRARWGLRDIGSVRSHSTAASMLTASW